MEADIITIKKNINLMSLALRKHFFLEAFQMTAIALMIHLNSSSDVHFFRYGTNLRINGHFEFSNGLWIIFIHVILQEPS